MDKCCPIPHMIPRNLRPPVASRVRRNIVFFGCSQLAFFHHAQTLDQSVHRVIFCSPESTPDAGILLFFWVVTKINQTTLLIFHFVFANS